MTKLIWFQYKLVNRATGKPLSRSPYFIDLSDGTDHFGYTDGDGATVSIAREATVTAALFVGEDALLRSSSAGS